MRKDNVLVALSAYNEAKVIADVIRDLRARGFKDILVVDDCSYDETSEVCKREGVIVVRHVVNRGHGAATATGIEYAKREGYDYVLTMDSDGQHSAEDAQKLLKYAEKYDVVMGSRLINFSEMPIQRKIANFVGSLITFFFFGLFVKDSQSGFKVFNRKAMDSIRITFDRYEFCSEIIGEIYRNKLTFVEVPITVIYTDYSKGKKGQSIANGFRMLARFVFKR